MAETKVKQNQLDMTQIADADLSNLSGSAPVGLTNTLAPLPKTVGYTVVGSPTIVNGVASGFSADDFLVIGRVPGGATSYHLHTEFVVGSSLPSGKAVIIGTTYQLYGSYGFLLGTDGKLYGNFYLTNADDDSEHSLFETYTGLTLSTNQKCYAEIDFSSADQTIVYRASTDGVNWTTQTATVPWSNSVMGGSDTRVGIGKGQEGYFTGSIDLNRTYIKANGGYWFVGRWTEINPAHLSAMSNTATKLTLTNDDIYTAPADGAFYIWGKGGGSGGGWLCMANNNETPYTSSIMAFDAGNGDLFTVYLPVKKGDKVRASLFGTALFDTANFSGMGFYFRYKVGNEFEAN